VTAGSDIVDKTQPSTYSAGVKQTFSPSTTTAGINVGTAAADPSSAADGDVWYNSTLRKMRCRENGATKDCSPAAGVADPGANGLMSRTAAGSATARTIQGTAGKIAVSNGDGVSGNPVVTAGSDIVDKTQSSTYTAGAKQTFSPSASTAGINVGAAVGDPSSAADGDVWYNSTLGKMRCRENGATKDCSAGAGLADPGASGMVARTAAGTAAARTIQGASGKISVTDGDGINANPVVTVGSDIVDKTQPSTYAAGVKQTFSPSASTAGINVGAAAADPSSAADGDVWYNSTLGKMRCRENGVVKDCSSTATGGTAAAIVGGQLNSAIGSGATNYTGPFGGALNGVEAVRALALPGPGTISNFYILTTSAQPAGCDLHAYINVAGVTSPMDVYVPGGSAAGTYVDAVHSVSFSDQQKVSLKFVNGACTSASIISWAFKVKY
jgi:hypothetical protein